MSTFTNETSNSDGSKNYSITAVREDGGNSVSATGFVSGYKESTSTYSVLGGSLNASHEVGHAVGLQAQHIPSFGNQVTASTNFNLLNTNNHRMDVNAHSTAHFPKSGPNFATHGAGAEYMFKEKVGVNANVAHTPMFKQTDYGVGGSLNLHKTPTTSFDFNAGGNRTVTPFHRGNWNKSVGFSFKKTF